MNMLTAEYNYEKDMAVQRQEAIQQGMQQGMQQGARLDKLEIAQKMLDLGYPVAEIARLTDLTAQEIGRLRQRV